MLRSRPYAGDQDLTALITFLAHARSEIHHVHHLHVGDLVWQLGHMYAGIDRATLLRLWETADGALRGFVLVYPGAGFFDLDVPPDVRGSAVEAEMLRWAETRLQAPTGGTSPLYTLVHEHGWYTATAYISALTTAVQALPATLTYNDFHWSNLALARRATPQRHAVVFDYDRLGIGLRASDVRNVLSVLGPAAVEAFAATYGPVDERERVLDAPIAVLLALHEAAQRPQLPSWARPLLMAVQTGDFARQLQQAVEVLAS